MIKKMTGSVGGYGHQGPVYGEITMGSMQKVANFLKDKCGLDESSSFLDIGAGLGKPNFHVAIDPGVRVSFGIEVEHLRWILSLKNLQGLRREKMTNVFMLQKDITQLATLDPFTHVYMFDVGFPPSVMVSIANSFNISRTAKTFICYKGPKYIIGKYGFDVRLIGQEKTSMCGSTESHMIYFYASTAESTGKRHQQTKISESFRQKRLRPSLGEQPTKKMRTDSGLAVKNLDDDGSTDNLDEEEAKLKLKIDPAVQTSLELLSNDSDCDVWVNDQIDQYFSGTRTSRRTSKRKG